MGNARLCTKDISVDMPPFLGVNISPFPDKPDENYMFASAKIRIPVEVSPESDAFQDILFSLPAVDPRKDMHIEIEFSSTARFEQRPNGKWQLAEIASPMIDSSMKVNISYMTDDDKKRTYSFNRNPINEQNRDKNAPNPFDTLGAAIDEAFDKNAIAAIRQKFTEYCERCCSYSNHTQKNPMLDIPYMACRFGDNDIMPSASFVENSLKHKVGNSVEFELDASPQLIYAAIRRADRYFMSQMSYSEREGRNRSYEVGYTLDRLTLPEYGLTPEQKKLFAVGEKWFSPEDEDISLIAFVQTMKDNHLIPKLRVSASIADNGMPAAWQTIGLILYDENPYSEERFPVPLYDFEKQILDESMSRCMAFAIEMEQVGVTKPPVFSADNCEIQKPEYNESGEKVFPIVITSKKLLAKLLDDFRQQNPSAPVQCDFRITEDTLDKFLNMHPDIDVGIECGFRGDSFTGDYESDIRNLYVRMYVGNDSKECVYDVCGDKIADSFDTELYDVCCGYLQEYKAERPYRNIPFVEKE